MYYVFDVDGTICFDGQVIGDAEYVAYGNDINDYELLKNASISHYVKKSDGEELLKCSVVLTDDSHSLSESIHSYLI